MPDSSPLHYIRLMDAMYIYIYEAYHTGDHVILYRHSYSQVNFTKHLVLDIVSDLNVLGCLFGITLFCLYYSRVYARDVFCTEE